MKHFGLILGLILFSMNVQAFSWQDLWATPNQQAQHLMNTGQFAQAKERFENKEWAATASYRAGDYKKAASLLKDRTTEEGFYNRGNALAQIKKYKEALQSYKRALAINPQNKDARFNHDLVMKLLKKEQEEQQQQNQNKNQKNDQQQDKDQKQQEQNSDKKNQDQKSQDKQKEDQKDKNTQNQNQDTQKDKEKKNQDQKNNNKTTPNKPSEDQHTKDQDKQNEERQNKPQEQPNQEVKSNDKREKDQAKQQWLQVIPDDPGGLLREKFLRDHVKRMRGWYQ